MSSMSSMSFSKIPNILPNIYYHVRRDDNVNTEIKKLKSEIILLK